MLKIVGGSMSISTGVNEEYYICLFICKKGQDMQMFLVIFTKFE